MQEADCWIENMPIKEIPAGPSLKQLYDLAVFNYKFA